MHLNERNARGRAVVAMAFALTLLIAAGLLYVLFRGMPDMPNAMETPMAPAEQTPNEIAAHAPPTVAAVPDFAMEQADAAIVAPTGDALPRVRIFGGVADDQGAPLGGMCVRWVPAQDRELARWSHDGVVLGVAGDATRIADTKLRDAFAKSVAAKTGEDGKYELKISEGAVFGVVVATGVGYETKLAPVNMQEKAPAPAEAPVADETDEAVLEVVDAVPVPSKADASTDKISVPREFEVDFALKAACTIAGTVLERETRTPAEGMFVVAGAVDRENLAMFDFVALEAPSAAVGRDGTYVLQGLPLGEYRVLPRTGESEYAGLRSKDAQRVTLQKGIDITGVDFLVSRGGVISGSVSGPDGKPLVAARVRLMPGNIMTASMEGDVETLMGLERDARRTSAEGAYEYRGLPLEKDYRVIVSKENLATGASDVVKLSVEQPQAQVDLALEVGSTIAGVVAYTDGTPAPKTKVVILPDMNDLARSMAGSIQTVTDDAGAFKLEHLLPGEVKLHAGPMSPEQVLTRTNAVTVVLDGTGDVTDVKIVIEKSATAALAGVVMDTWGTPLEGAQVSAASTDGMNVMVAAQAASNSSVSSGREGKFAFAELKGGMFKLTATKPGYSPASVADVAAGTCDVELRLARHGRISGLVVTAAGQTPGGGGKVIARPIVTESLMASIQRLQATGMAGPQDAGTQVGDDGSFSVEAPVGKVEVRATLPGFAPARSEHIEVVAGQEYGGVKIVVTSGAIVRGHVTLGDDSPIEGATVQVSLKESDESSAMLRQLLPQLFGSSSPTNASGADGLFAVEHLAEGEYVVSATHPKFAPAEPVTVALGRDQVCDTVKLVLQRGGAIAGKILEQEKPKGGMLVQLMGGKGAMKRLTTDGTGEFWFNNLQAGEYILNIMDMAALQKGAMSVKNRVVNVENERTSEVTIAIGAGRKVFGKVKNYPAAPMRVLTLRKPGGPNPEDVKTMDMKASLESAKFQVGVGIVTQDDKYEIVDIEPGTYILEAPRMPANPADFESYAKMENRAPFFRKEITLKDEDLELDVEIK